MKIVLITEIIRGYNLMGTTMNKDELFMLYKKVQQKDRAAEDQLIAEHRKRFPDNEHNKRKRGESDRYRNDLHTMYLHLTR